MTRDEVVQKLQEIFRDVFDDDSIVLFDKMTSNDVEDWDSLSHINLINDIEAKFNVSFTTEEVISTKNVGEFISLIEKKLS